MRGRGEHTIHGHVPAARWPSGLDQTAVLRRNLREDELALGPAIQGAVPPTNAEIESHFGLPDHETRFDPLFCVLNLQNLFDCI